MNVRDLGNWINAFKKKELEQYFLSEPIPEENDNPLKKIVSRTWRDTMLTTKNEVLVLITKPGDADCEKEA